MPEFVRCYECDEELVLAEGEAQPDEPVFCERCEREAREDRELVEQFVIESWL